MGIAVLRNAMTVATMTAATLKTDRKEKRVWRKSNTNDTTLSRSPFITIVDAYKMALAPMNSEMYYV